MARSPFGAKAQWIWSAEGMGASRFDRGAHRVRLFRRRFQAPRGARLEVHVSADTRYELVLNGWVIGRGPAPATGRVWYYDTHDLSGRLLVGENVLAAEVRYYGDCFPDYGRGGAPCAAPTEAPGFVAEALLVGPGGEAIEDLSTDSRWRVAVDEACAHGAPDAASDSAGSFTGWFENADLARRPRGWAEPGFDDAAWHPATELARAERPDTVRDSMGPWRLVPREIPPLEETACRFAGAVRAEPGTVEEWNALLREDRPVRVGKEQSRRVVIDAGTLTTARPRLRFRGGRGAGLRLVYAEAMTRDGKKIPRNDFSGEIRGLADRVALGGGEGCWQPFDWRAFRFVELDIRTAGEGLELCGCDFEFTAYPFERKAKYASSDPEHARILDVAWRTLRCSCHEIFEDCPYYERLQYAGDAEVEAMAAYYGSGDGRLARQALRHFDDSRRGEELTQSRTPSRTPQIIPAWSLRFVHMVADYAWMTGDVAGAVERMDGVASVLRWFARHIGKSGLVERLEWWGVADWCPTWPGGVPPGTYDSASALFNFNLIYALRRGAWLADAARLAEAASSWRTLADNLLACADEAFWSDRHRCYRDCRESDALSQGTNAFAILAGVRHDRAAAAVGRMFDGDLGPATLYGLYHVFRACAAVGGQDAFFTRGLDPWREMLAKGLTTFAEEPKLGRSECHGWSACPIVEFLGVVLGVQPASPGFAEVLVRPLPGPLTWAQGEVPTPRGPVSVEWERANGRLRLRARAAEGVALRVRLPDGTERGRSAGGEIAL